MNTIRLHSGPDSQMTCVSNIFIDEYMPAANGNHVKVYLYLLRCILSGQMNFSISTISDLFDYTEGDVMRSLRYWEKEQLLRLKTNSQGILTELYLLTPASKQARPVLQEAKTTSSSTDIPSVEPPAVKNISTQAAKTYTHKDYTPEEICALKKEANYDAILKVLEGYLGHPLNAREIQTATFIYKELQFSTDLIYHLYEYCVGRGKCRPQYIEQVAISWAEANIQTPEEAELASVAYNEDYTVVCQTFGLHRMPGKIEKNFIDHWVKDLGFERRIIVEACNRTLLNIQKPDFNYANRILEHWHKEGVRAFCDIAKQDALRKNKQPAAPNKPASNNQFHAFQQRNYSKEDYSSLEKRLLEKSLQS